MNFVNTLDIGLNKMEIEELKVIIATAEGIILHQIRIIEAADVQVDSIDISASCQTIGYRYLTVDDVKIRVSI